jgi:hypothetical protein
MQIYVPIHECTKHHARARNFDRCNFERLVSNPGGRSASAISSWISARSFVKIDMIGLGGVPDVAKTVVASRKETRTFVTFGSHVGGVLL